MFKSNSIFKTQNRILQILLQFRMIGMQKRKRRECLLICATGHEKVKGKVGEINLFACNVNLSISSLLALCRFEIESLKFQYILSKLLFYSFLIVCARPLLASDSNLFHYESKKKRSETLMLYS